MKNTNKLNLEYVDIDKLIIYENNSKIHTDEQIDQIVESIKEFGFSDVIGIDEKNMILFGAGRYMAAQKLDMKQVPVIRIDKLTEEQKKAYIIANNKLGHLTTFDLEKLNEELQSMDEELQELTGFSDEEVSDIFDSLVMESTPSKQSRKSITIKGDKWELDGHTLTCGDSLTEDIDFLIRKYIKYKGTHDEEYTIKLIRDGKEISLEDSGILDD